MDVFVKDASANKNGRSFLPFFFILFALADFLFTLYLLSVNVDSLLYRESEFYVPFFGASRECRIRISLCLKKHKNYCECGYRAVILSGVSSKFGPRNAGKSARESFITL